ncbi:integrase domain-containing protein [Xenorhabdus bovienii]|nr:phage integrase N-terminal domain-containing protein [Xenorhabdus bovienii]MDE1484660.1 integrase domain-containing protein [Xenorhabdus bovienii]
MRQSHCERIARQFLDYLKNNGIKLRQMDSLKAWYIEGYIARRKADNIFRRTLQNEMSALRSILTQVGKHKLADPDNSRLSNQTLSIAGASRNGTKIALTPAEFREAFHQVEQKDRCVAAAMQLASKADEHYGWKNSMRYWLNNRRETHNEYDLANRLFLL